MATSGNYDRTKEDSRAFRTFQDTTAQARDEAGVATAAAMQTATRASSNISAISTLPATVTLDISNGETALITYTTTPAGLGVQLTHVSSDPTKATVDANGLITPVAAGSTTITSTAVHNPSLTDTTVVTVQA